jgi:hypothetical protein
MSSTSRSRSFRKWGIASAIAIAAMVGALLVATSAQADTTVLSGVVHGPTGLPLSGVTVSGVNVTNNAAAVDATAKTSSTGAFTFAALPLSTDTLSFSATSTTFFQYLGGTSNIQDYEILGNTVDTSHDHGYITVALSASGTITGKVTKAPSGAVSGYTVRAYSEDPSGGWSIAGTGKTSSSGAYSIPGLEPGSYRLEALDATSAHPAYTPEYSGGGTVFSSAGTVGVVASKTSSYNFVVGKAGSVSGTVTGTHGSPAATEKLGAVHVTVYRLTGTPSSFTSAEALDSPSTVTSSTGTYTVSGLAPGYYTLEFNPPAAAPYSPSGTRYGRTFLGGGSEPTQATPFLIGNGTAVAGQNVQLSGTATISGTVFDVDIPTFALSNVRVELDYQGRNADLPSEHAQVVHTAADGSFSFSDIGPGNYELYVGSNASVDADYQSEAWEWVRQVVTVPGPISSGDNAEVDVYLSHMSDFFLYAPTAPALSQSSGNVGDTISVDNGVWDSPDVTDFTYQWFKSGQLISGATQSSYTLQPDDRNEFITARVTGYSFGYGYATAASNGFYPDFGTLVTPSPAASISGTNAVGSTLTVDPGGWSVSGVLFNFVWQVSPNGSSWIDAQNSGSPTFDLTGSDYLDGDQVRVKIDASKLGYNPFETIADAAGTLQESQIHNVTLPTVKKTSAGFSLAGGVWDPIAKSIDEVDWVVTSPNGTPTDYLNQPVLTLGQAGTNYVTVTETHKYDGWQDGSTSPIVAQLGAAPKPTGSNVLSATPQVGVTVSAPSPSWLPTTGTSTYQWEYELSTTWKVIAGATDPNFTPTSGYLGRLLRVITTRKDTGYTTATLVTTASAKVATGAAPTIFIATTSGTVGTGDTLTASPLWLPAPTSLGFQWEYASSPSGPYSKISGATKSSYLIPQSLVGKYLFVNETAALAGHTTGSSFRQLGQVAVDQLTLVTTPKVTVVGGVYTVSNVTFSPAVPASDVQYEWYSYNENDSTPLNTFTDQPTQNVGANANANEHWAVDITVPSSASTNFYSYALNPVPGILIKKGAIIPSGPTTLPASQVGQAIVPPTISWLVQNPTLTHQWQYESGTTWKSIAASAGGTAATFTPSSIYLNHPIRVITTASRANYVTATQVSSSTTVALGATLVPGTSSNAASINGYGISAPFTALPGVWNQTGLSYHYQWASGASATGPWTTITGATAVAYTPGTALLGKYLQVTITGSKAGYGSAQTIAVSNAIQDGQIKLLSAPKVTLSAGTYKVASNGVWSPTATSYEYDWELFDPATDSSTAEGTMSSYTPLAADAGKEIQLTIYPDRMGYTSGGTTVIVRSGAAIAPTSPITLTGTAVVGGTLTLTVPGWNTVNPEVHVAWYRNGVATGTNINEVTYPLTAADFGKTISAKLTVLKTGYPSATFSFASTPIFSDFAIVPTSDPVITGGSSDGSAPVGKVLGVTTGTWNATGLTYTYQWTRSGAAIPGATASSYQLAYADFGNEINVTVRAGKTDFTPASDSAQAITVEQGGPITNSLASPLKITGTAKLGNVLTLSILGKWSVPSTVQVQWVYSTDGGSTWNYITGATGYTYTLSAADGVAVGNEVTATVFATAPGYLSYGENSPGVTVIS